jgi:hypothetical protein
LILVAPLAGLLAGCVIYDTRGKCAECGDGDRWWDEDSGRADHEEPTPDDTDADGDPDGDAETSFVVDPSEIEVGQTLIASLTSTEAFDFAGVTSVELYGDATLLATDIRSDEVLLTVSVAVDATPGTIDLVLVNADGSAELLNDAIAIVAVGEAGGGDDDDGTDESPDTGVAGSDDDCP